MEGRQEVSQDQKFYFSLCLPHPHPALGLALSRSNASDEWSLNEGKIDVSTWAPMAAWAEVLLRMLPQYPQL